MSTKKNIRLILIVGVSMIPGMAFAQEATPIPLTAAAHRAALTSELATSYAALRASLIALRPRSEGRTNLIACARAVNRISGTIITAQSSRDLLAQASGQPVTPLTLAEVLDTGVAATPGRICTTVAGGRTTAEGIVGALLGRRGALVAAATSAGDASDMRAGAVAALAEAATLAEPAPAHDTSHAEEMIIPFEVTDADEAARMAAEAAAASEAARITALTSAPLSPLETIREFVTQNGGIPHVASSVLSQDDLNTLFPTTAGSSGVSISYGGPPGYQATLRGTIPAICAPAFEIRNSSMAADATHPLVAGSDADGPIVGFQISDYNGVGRACMASVRARHLFSGCETEENTGRTLTDGTLERNPNHCISLSRMDGGQASFANVPAGRVGLIYTDASRDASLGNPAVILGDVRSHRPRSTILAELNERNRAREAATITRLAGTASRCRGTHIEEAASALDALRAGYTATQIHAVLPGFNFGEVEASIRRGRLDALQREVAHADVDRLAEIRVEVLTHLENNPEDARRVQTLYERIANRYLALAPENPEAFAEARASIDELAATGSYEGAALARLTHASFQLQMTDMQRQASQPNAQFNMSLWNNWQQMYQQTYQAMFQCQGGGSSMMGGSFSLFGGGSSYGGGAAPSIESCTAAAEQFQSVSSVPRYAAQAAQQRQQMQMQMQQAMNSAMMGASGGGNPSMMGGGMGSAFSGGSFGGPMPMTSPMGMNPGIF